MDQVKVIHAMASIPLVMKVQGENETYTHLHKSTGEKVVKTIIQGHRGLKLRSKCTNARATFSLYPSFSSMCHLLHLPHK